MRYAWSFWARPNQREPVGTAWTTWLILGGRGAGKTRTGAEWISAQVEAGAGRLALVGETYEDAREVMIEGPSGLYHVGRPDTRPTYEPSRHRLVWPNGAEAHVFSADDPDGMRGFQFEMAWSDEITKWRYPDESWSNLQLGLRLGERPRQVVTTTPKPMELLRKLMDQVTTETTRSTTYDNAAHLAPTFLTEIASTYEGTRLGRQELLGEIIDDVAGALWSWALIEGARVTDMPDCERIIVAVDPPVTSGPEADECGMVVAGMSTREGVSHAYVLEDASAGGLSPAQWAAKAVELYRHYNADRIVAEVNQGGDLVEQMIRMIEPEVSYRGVRASRGKLARAEPVAALYEQGRVHHVSPFPELERQLTSYTGADGKSPDRLDALVWAITDLMLGPAHNGPMIRTL